MATASEDPNLTIRASACSEFEAEFHACEAGIWRRRAATSDKFPKPPGARFVRMEDWNPWAARPKKAEKSRLGLRSVFLVADFRARMVVWQK